MTVNTAPVPEGTIDEITVAEGAETMLVVSGYFSDADGDALSFEATSSDDDIATTSAADSTVTINGHAPARRRSRSRPRTPAERRPCRRPRSR